MSIEVQWPDLDVVGRLSFAVVRQYRKQDPGVKLFSGTVVGDQIHWETWNRPPLFPGELEDLAKALRQISVEARKRQA